MPSLPGTWRLVCLSSAAAVSSLSTMSELVEWVDQYTADIDAARQAYDAREPIS